MRETIVTCDLCKGTINNDAQTWNVCIYARCGYKPHVSSVYESPELALEICRPCLDRLGIQVGYRKPEDIVQPIPTIEDVIRELVLNVVSERMD